MASLQRVPFMKPSWLHIPLYQKKTVKESPLEMPNMLPCSAESSIFNDLPQGEAWGETAGQQWWPPYVKPLPSARACHMLLMRKLRPREVGDLSKCSLVMKQWHGSPSKALSPTTASSLSNLYCEESQEDDCGGTEHKSLKMPEMTLGQKRKETKEKKKFWDTRGSKAKMVNNHHKRKWGDAVYK